MATINLTVNGHEITCTNEEKPVLSQGSHNIDTVIFTYDSTYSGYTLYATMYQSMPDPVLVELSNNSCKIPIDALLYPGKVRIGLRAENSQGSVIATSCLEWFNVEPGAIDGSEGTSTSGIASLANRIEALESAISGDSVPTEVRRAMLALFNSAAYAETGLTDEIAVIASWAAVVTAISINQSSISISGANTSQLVATTTPAGGAVTWASSNPAVATVSNNGLVTGVGNGTATITASCGGKKATCSVTVSGFATLTGITATYTQSGTVYNTDSLDSLKSDLVVVATYSDSTTRTLSDSDYTLSGTLEVGTSTITVTYGGESATFNVVISKPMSFFKNFSDISWTPGYIDNNGEYVSDSSNAFCDEYIDAEYPSGFALVYNTAATNNNVTIYEFDSNDVFLGKETGTPFTYVSNAGTSKVKLGCASSITSSTVDAFLKIEKTNESSALTIQNTNLGTNGEETTATGKSCSDFISLDAYTSPVYFISSVNGGIVLCFYDENRAFMSRVAKGSGWACNAIPSGAKYIRIACSVGEGYSQFSSFLI